jgi:hypothetical protein
VRNFTEFWVATAAAAPVIALAAVVALPDLTTAEFEVVKRLYDKAIADGVKDAGFFHEPRAERLLRNARIARGMTMANVIIQAVLLAVALGALATDQNLMPPLAAVVLAVGGILLLSWTIRGATTLGERQRDYLKQTLGTRPADKD